VGCVSGYRFQRERQHAFYLLIADFCEACPDGFIQQTIQTSFKKTRPSFALSLFGDPEFLSHSSIALSLCAFQNNP
jgi:hypothetical protein